MTETTAFNGNDVVENEVGDTIQDGKFVECEA